MLNESVVDKEYNDNLKSVLAQSLKDELGILNNEFEDYRIEVENPEKLKNEYDAKINIYDDKNKLVGYIIYFENHYLNIRAYTADDNMIAREIGDWGEQKNIPKLIRTLIDQSDIKLNGIYEGDINSLSETIDLEKKPESSLEQADIEIEKNYISNTNNSVQDFVDLGENIYLGKQDGLVIKEIPDSVRPKFLKKTSKQSNINYASKKDYPNVTCENNIDYEKGWVLKRNPEPEKLHNKFAKDEKQGLWYGISPSDIGE